MKTDVAENIHTIMFNNENKYMMKSSLLFLLPGLYGLKRKEYTCSSLMILGSLISLNYWRDPKPGFRRNLDLYFVRFCVPTFGYNILYSIDTWYNIFLISGIYGIGKLFFFKASYEYYKKNRFWYIYHLGFHSFCFFGHICTSCLLNI